MSGHANTDGVLKEVSQLGTGFQRCTPSCTCVNPVLLLVATAGYNPYDLMLQFNEAEARQVGWGFESTWVCVRVVGPCRWLVRWPGCLPRLHAGTPSV